MKQSETHIKEAEEFLNINDINSAIASYKLAIALDDVASTKICLAVSYIANNNGAEAERELLEVVNNNKYQKSTYIALAYNNLSTLYITGAKGVNVDFEKSLSYTKKAKEMGFPEKLIKPDSIDY
jgi:TPR repeat protein